MILRKRVLNEICLPQPLINYQLCIFILTLIIIINATFFDFKKHFFICYIYFTILNSTFLQHFMHLDTRSVFSPLKFFFCNYSQN